MDKCPDTCAVQLAILSCDLTKMAGLKCAACLSSSSYTAKRPKKQVFVTFKWQYENPIAPPRLTYMYVLLSLILCPTNITGLYNCPCIPIHICVVTCTYIHVYTPKTKIQHPQTNITGFNCPCICTVPIHYLCCYMIVRIYSKDQDSAPTNQTHA